MSNQPKLRSYKSISGQRFPNENYRSNYDQIDWGKTEDPDRECELCNSPLGMHVETKESSTCVLQTAEVPTCVFCGDNPDEDPSVGPRLGGSVASCDFCWDGFSS